jgi:hypothetical protein
VLAHHTVEHGRGSDRDEDGQPVEGEQPAKNGDPGKARRKDNAGRKIFLPPIWVRTLVALTAFMRSFLLD